MILGAMAAVLLPQPAAVARSMWAGQFPAPLQEYLTRAFDPFDVCVSDEEGLTAADMHVRGSPRELTQSFTVYNDDGTIEMKTRTVVDFSRTGQIQSLVETTQDNETIDKSVYQYDKLRRLTEIDAADPKLQANCVAKFLYDKSGHLVRITSLSTDGTAWTVDIAYGVDGRLKEALQRRSTGKAEWRLAYSYENSSVTIERYFSNDLSEGSEKATFQFDPLGRPKQINDSSHDSTFGDEIGTYVYTYLPSGISLMHAEVSDRGKPCIYDFSLHSNGSVDLNSIKTLGESNLLCHAPGGSARIVQTDFDRHGNEVIDREGDEVQELGRTVDRWKYVTMNAISYY